MAASTLLDELFAAGDARFLAQVRESVDAAALATLAEKWFRDARPQLRAALLAYIDEDCARAHHKALVKRLFKLADVTGNDELMAHFLCAFDRWTGRRLKTHAHWNFKMRAAEQKTTLSFRLDVPARMPKPYSGRNPTTGKLITIPARSLPVFSRRTRAYLTRRAFRYFRRLGFHDPARYRSAMARALVLYKDEELQKPEQLLDAWGLVHALYGRSKVIERKPGGVRLAEGHTLKELELSPMFEDAWWDGFDDLLTIVERAQCRPVRAFALQMLRRHHDDKLHAMPLSRLRSLLRSPVEEVQAFAAELLKSAPGLDALPIAEWLELLRIESMAIVSVVCALVKEHVSPDRLSLSQCVELARATVAPVAELGLAWAKTKPVGEGDLEVLTSLAKVRAPVVRAEAIDWVVSIFKATPQTRAELVRDLIDAAFADVRAKGLALMLEDARFKDAAILWTALAESPWDEVRASLVKHLSERAQHFGPETVRHVWAATLLAVHRGGRAKRTVTRQLAERIAQRPGDADSLLPLLKVALRSIRAPERRAALSALAQVAFTTPSLRASMAKALPELKLFPAEA